MPTVESKKNQQVHRLILANGITVIAVENQAADLIATKIFWKNSGARWDKREKAGVSHLLASVLMKGTEKLSSVEIADKIESIGASLGAEATNDYLMMSIKTVTDDFPEMLKLAGEIMRYPSFPDTEIELEKYLTIQNIKSQQEAPFNVAFNQLREAMYPNHPYRLSVLGTEETVTTITRADLLETHQTFFRPDNIIISLSGRLIFEETLKLIEEIFGDWQPPSQEIPTLQLHELQNNPCEKVTHQDSQQSIVMLGYLTCAITNTDFATLKLINSYLGNGLSSRLFVELREKRGLAYDVSAFYPTRLHDSQLVTYIGTAPENTAIALEGLRAEVERLCNEQLSQEEVEAAKNKLLGQYALGKQTNGEIAQINGWYETMGVGIDFDSQFTEDIKAVTPKKIQEVANRYLTKPYISIVGPKEYCSFHSAPLLVGEG